MIRYALIALSTLGLATAAQAATINVTFSEDFAEKLEEDYGVREGAKLTEDIIDDLERELEGKEDQVERIDVTILDAKPNRPTFEQISGTPGLDPLRSVSIGGMSLAGKVVHIDGDVSEVEYKWFENDIRDSVGAATWWDANRASRRFAKRVADSVSDE
ncbi:MAG: hypothetical protein AAF829_02330 [Pseudomonadota bacterium]